MTKIIRFIDLFAGVGGFHFALQKSINQDSYKIECVFVSEINTEAINTYVANFPINPKNIIDIKKIDDQCSQIPDHDFLFAGFPCQPFSNAGKKKGFSDANQGNLFFDIVKILEIKKPKYILLENVKHIVNHNNGTTWKLINNKLNEIGYIIPRKPLIFSPHEFGIPQERKRVFIPGVLKEKLSQSIEEININLECYKHNILNNNRWIETRKYIDDNFLILDVPKKYFLTEKNDKYLLSVFNAWDEFIKKIKIKNGRTLPVIWVDEFTKTYDISNFSKWKQKYIVSIREVYDNNKKFINSWMKKYNVHSWKIREKKFEWQAGKNINDIKNTFIQLRQSGIRCKKPTKFPTLVAMVQIPIIYDNKYKKFRYLMPREVANLQSFPKNFILNQKSDYESYKQMGNAINVKIASLIIKEILKYY